MLRTQIITIMLCGFAVMMQACSCSPIAPFMQSIEQEDIIFQAEVLEEIELPLDEIRAKIRENIARENQIDENSIPLPPPYLGLKSISKLKVTRWFQNELQSDTIFYQNSDGNSCNRSIARQVGKTLIIKARLKELSFYKLNLSELQELIPQSTKWVLVKGKECDTEHLLIDAGKVTGTITKSAVYKYLLKARKLPEDAHEARKHLRQKMLVENKLQRMTYRKFLRLIKRNVFR